MHNLNFSAHVCVQIWRCGEGGLWQEEEALPGHSDWVRDVAWAPSLGLPRSTIASAGQDGQVCTPAQGCSQKSQPKFCRLPYCISLVLLMLHTAGTPDACWRYWHLVQVFAWCERASGGGWDRRLVHDFKVCCRSTAAMCTSSHARPFNLNPAMFSDAAFQNPATCMIISWLMPCCFPGACVACQLEHNRLVTRSVRCQQCCHVVEGERRWGVAAGATLGHGCRAGL
jgi:hypothetical protein